MANLSNLNEISYFRTSRPEFSLIIDTNVLLLLLIGSYNEEYLKDCSLMKNNGRNYEKQEYRLLMSIISRFCNKIFITPQILSEIYSLSDKNLGGHFKNYFIKAIEKLKECEEKYICHKIILNDTAILEFGFTDISIIKAALEIKAVVLTDEENMYRKFYDIVPMIRFSHIIASEIHQVKI